MSITVFVLGLSLLPFIFWPWARVVYEVPRVVGFCLWVEILLFSLIIAAFNKKIRLSFASGLGKRVGIFLAAVVLSIILGVDQCKSIIGNYWRLDGLVTLLHLIVLVFCISWFWRWKLRRLTSVGIFLSTSIVSGWAVLQAIQNNGGAVGVSFGNPILLAGYLVVTLPFGVFLLNDFQEKALKILVFIGIILQIIAIVLTKSWGGVAGIIAFTAVGLWLFIKRKHRWSLAVVSVILLAIVTLMVWQKLYSPLPMQIMAEGRGRIFTKAILAWIKRPIFGWGWANFDHAFASVDWPYHFNFDAYVDKAHSQLLEILVTTGLAGVVCYVSLIGYTVRNLIKSKTVFAKYLLWVFLLYLFHSQTNIISINEELMFWVVVGIAGSGIKNS